MMLLQDQMKYQKKMLNIKNNMQTILAIVLVVATIHFFKSLSEEVITNILIIGGAIAVFLVLWFSLAFLVKMFVRIVLGKELW